MALSGAQLRQCLEQLGATVSLSAEAQDYLAFRIQAINEDHKAGYEFGWSRTRAKLDRAMKTAHCRDDLLRAMIEPQAPVGLFTDAIGTKAQFMNIDPAGFTPQPDHMLVVADNAYKQVNLRTEAPFSIAETVATYITDETDIVCELGCGWGRNLAELAPCVAERKTRLVGGEQSESGRFCTKALLDMAPSCENEVFAFDFYAPDLAPLSGGREILVFTAAAIEQITFLPTGFIESLLDLAERVTIVFFEPFAWQSDMTLHGDVLSKFLSEVGSGEDTDLRRIFSQHTFRMSNERINVNAAVWAYATAYNQNLFRIITTAVADKMIEVREFAPNHFGVNPFNPYSVAVLQKC